MDDPVTVGSQHYFFFLMLLLASRGADFLSTWIATPNMVLEGNPLAKMLGWKWGSFINLVLCGVFAAWPLAASIFHSGEFTVPDVKQFLAKLNIPVRL